jgi:hypothetical protein
MLYKSAYCVAKGGREEVTFDTAKIEPRVTPAPPRRVLLMELICTVIPTVLGFKVFAGMVWEVSVPATVALNPDGETVYADNMTIAI